MAKEPVIPQFDLIRDVISEVGLLDSGGRVYLVPEIRRGATLQLKPLPFVLDGRAVVCATLSVQFDLGSQSYECLERYVKNRQVVRYGYGFDCEQNHHNTPFLVLRTAWFTTELTPQKLEFMLNNFTGTFRAAELMAANPPQRSYLKKAKGP